MRFAIATGLVIVTLIGALAQSSVPGQSPPEPWKNQPILDVSKSPQARVHGVPVRAVKMGEGFWAARRRVTIEKSIPSLYELFEANGIIDNFRRLSGRKNVPRKGPLYTDSDVYKWMEAVAFVLQSEDRPELGTLFDRVADDVLAAQEPSGYLNTYYQDDRKALRFTEMHQGHELYCLGHLLQAAIAYYRATGNRHLLDGATRYADYVVSNFGPIGGRLSPGIRNRACARRALSRHGPEEMPRLHRLHPQRRRRGLKLTAAQMVYMFSGRPFTERTRLEGTPFAPCMRRGHRLLSRDREPGVCWTTLQTLWRDMVGHKMSITGGVGSRQGDEAFGDSHPSCPTSSRYRSCAAIGNSSGTGACWRRRATPDTRT
jgi:DUF1680 family protein